jgi:ATP-dependent RNA helicase DDX46/PRP5
MEIEQQQAAARKKLLSEEDYFGEDDDEMTAPPPPPKREKMDVETVHVTITSQAEDEDEEDPLDAFMKGVTKEVDKLQEEDLKRDVKVVDMESILRMKPEEDDGKRPKHEGLGFRMEQDDNMPDIVSDEEAEKEFDIKQWLDSKNQSKNLRPVDHSKIEYEPFKKNFLRLVPEIAGMTDDEIRVYRGELDGIKVRGKRVPPPIKNWFQCGLNDRTLAVIKKLGWTKPTPIQCQALPVVMSGRDCIGVAKTGSGKTASYLLPCFRHILDQRVPEEREGPIAIIFTPARELCIQVYLTAKKFLKHLGIRGCAVYGGAPVAEQIAELNKSPQLVVCTPGRMIDMLCANSGRVTNLRRVTYITVDEADRMFDLGFEPQITKIMENTRPDAQKVLLSATFPKQMEILARKHLKNPVEMIVGGRSVVSSTIEHYVELREENTKFLRTLELLGEWFDKGQILLFVERQDACDALMASLIKHGYPCMTLHGGMDQADRDSTLADFKNKVTTILVATSLAARGLDVKDLNLVVNYDTPSHYEDYVHRVGRTGRAGNKGTAYTFVSPSQKELIPDLVKALTLSKKPVPKDLRAFVNDIKAARKAGQGVKKGSGFGGKGFKFDEEEMKKKMEAEKKNKRLLLIENGEEVCFFCVCVCFMNTWTYVSVCVCVCVCVCVEEVCGGEEEK